MFFGISFILSLVISTSARNFLERLICICRVGRKLLTYSFIATVSIRIAQPAVSNPVKWKLQAVVETFL